MGLEQRYSLELSPNDTLRRMLEGLTPELTPEQHYRELLPLNPGDKVLDVCAGTNGVGIELLRRQPDIAVVAIDRSAAMQEVGRRKAREAGLVIESVIGDVHELPFRDESFDPRGAILNSESPPPEDTPSDPPSA